MPARDNLPSRNQLNHLCILEDAAYHEAGHVIVGMAQGRKYTAVWINDDGTGEVAFEPWAWRHPVCGGSATRVRHGLVLDVAGGVAEDLLEEVRDHGELSAKQDREQLAALSRVLGGRPGYRRISALLSTLQEAGGLEGDLEGDRENALRKAEALALKGFLSKSAATGLPAPGEAPSVITHHDCWPDALAEILQAESRAERIIVRNWAGVCRLAVSLFRRKSHRMTARQVARLIGAVRRPAGQTERGRARPPRRGHGR